MHYIRTAKFFGYGDKLCFAIGTRDSGAVPDGSTKLHGVDMFLSWIKKFFAVGSKDLSLHRAHTTKYEDLCM